MNHNPLYMINIPVLTALVISSVPNTQLPVHNLSRTYQEQDNYSSLDCDL